MSKQLSDRDHSELKRFIADTRRKLAAIQTHAASLDALRIERQDFCFAIPDARINHASQVSGTLYSPAAGNATIYRYTTNNPDVRFDVVDVDLAKVRLYNMHRGMWLWDQVVYPCHRDHYSGLWFAVVEQGPIIKCRPTAPLAPNGTGTVQIYRDSTAVSGLTVAGVKHDWMDGGNTIATSTDCLMKWFEEDLAWTIIEAECPPA